jgi:hypothetical protein
MSDLVVCPVSIKRFEEQERDVGIPLPFKSGEKIMSNSSSKGTALEGIK